MPVVLACGHTFCRECLEGWAAKSDIVFVAAGGGGSGVSCPTCRSVCSVAVEDLPINYGVLDGAVTLCRCNFGDAIDMALNDMATEAICGACGEL
jgi:hypothetical protein